MSSLADYREKAVDVSGGNNAKRSIPKVAAMNPADEAMAKRAAALDLEKHLEHAAKKMAENQLLYYNPYTKQRQFHAMGAEKKERLLMAGNQTGKTWCGGAETAMHLTGLYPKWWEGRRFDHPPRGWVAGVTAESTRDVIQRVLLGTKADGLGTGMIPKDKLGKTTMARGVSDLLDTVLVKHKSGGFSEVKFKTYEKGQEKWQGETLDFLWFDEEPPLDVYTEGYTRTVVKNGLMWMTFTPLQGKSKVVTRFMDEDNPTRGIVQMTIADAEHIPQERRDAIVAGWPEHEREARARGIPMLGSGAVFDIPESQITVDPFEIPKHWSLIWGMDFGVDHPFAAVLHAWDRDSDTVYVIHGVRLRGATPLQHADAMKRVLGCGDKVPVAWPHDVAQRREFEGALVPLARIYKKYGLNMGHSHAAFEDGTNSTEVGILHMRERMKTGRFKVFRTMSDWFGEYRNYHRVDGVIKKDQDDLLSASRMAIMALRFAKPVRYFSFANAQAPLTMARDVDIDPFM